MKSFPLVVAGLLAMAGAARCEESLRMIVMDPLALPLSCTCVEGTGQRRYEILAGFLEERLGRPVEVVFEESVKLARRRMEDPAHLIVGKRAMVRADVKAEGIEARAIAELTGVDGSAELRGVFLVAKGSAMKTLADLAGKKVALGPVEDAECNGAAREALRAAGVEVEFSVAGSIDSAALALHDGEVEAAVVSSFLPKLLEGCGKIEKGTTRVLGTTGAVPFVTVFATAAVPAELEEEILGALEGVVGDEKVLAVMESAKGFRRIKGSKSALRRPRSGTQTSGAKRRDTAEPASEASGIKGFRRIESAVGTEGWTDWRGEGRAGRSEAIPKKLPEEPVRVWTAKLTGPAMAGVAVAGGFVVVPDKDAEFKKDVIRGLDAGTGREVWRVEYEAAEDVDYSNAPRATPVIVEGLVYVQGATGELRCLELSTGKTVWRRNIFTEFGAELLFWGSSCAPLVVDDLLVFNPGGKEASLVAVDRRTGEVRWKTPGHAAAYSSLVLGTFSGVRQIVGYDVASLGGWDPETGERLWEFVPPDATDFNVTTPVILGERVLLATENNGTRLYGFDAEGKLIPEPVAVNEEMAPDTCSPVEIDGRVFATAYGELFCLDLEKGLAKVWAQGDDMFYDHSNVLAGNGRVMVWTIGGDLLLLKAGAEEYDVVSKWRPFGEKSIDSMAHPAIAGKRIYLRATTELVCIVLGE